MSRKGPERELLAVRPQGSPGPDPQPEDWQNMCSRAWQWAEGGPGWAEELEGGHQSALATLPTPLHPIPAVFKHSHQTGHRCQLLLTLLLHSVDLQGGPQVPLKQRRWPPTAPSATPTRGHRWAKASWNVLQRAQEACSQLQSKKEEVVPEPQPQRERPLLPLEGGAHSGPAHPPRV